MYMELRLNGESEEDAAKLVDLAICEDFERLRLKREPTTEGNTTMAKLPDTSSGNGRANIVDGYELESTHAALKEAPANLAEAAGRVADLRHDLIEVKSIKLVDAKAALDRTISGATMEAYGNGIINGKNQAERDLQIAAYLDKDKAVQTAKLSVRHWETQLAGIEARLEMVEAEYKAAWAKLSAARAAAALQTSYLQFLTTQADVEAEPTAEGYEHPF